MNRDSFVEEMPVSRPYGAEHERLILMLEHLHDALLFRGHVPTLGADLENLAEYARKEFVREEEALRCYGTQAVTVHRREHQAMLAKLGMLRRRLHGGIWTDAARGDLYDLLSEWLVHARWET